MDHKLIRFMLELNKQKLAEKLFSANQFSGDEALFILSNLPDSSNNESKEPSVYNHNAKTVTEALGITGELQERLVSRLKEIVENRKLKKSERAERLFNLSRHDDKTMIYYLTVLITLMQKEKEKGYDSF